MARRTRIGLLSLCSLLALAGRLSAEERSLERLAVDVPCQALPQGCPTGAAHGTLEELRVRDRQRMLDIEAARRDEDRRRHDEAVRRCADDEDATAAGLPAASIPPEDLITCDCHYVGLQVEWMASKRDLGLPLVAVLASAQRVFAQAMPLQSAIVSAMGPLVYRYPQRSPEDLRQAMEAECLMHPLLWTDRRYDW